MTPKQKQYFDDLKPGEMKLVSEVRNPELMITAGKEYIDMGGALTFTDDYSSIVKPNPIPKSNISTYFFSE